MKEIIATNGMTILVDDEDYPLLSRHSWYIHFSKEGRPYATTKLKTDHTTIWRCIFMHQMILATSAETDHNDRNSLNNQKENLRVATRQQNGWNKGKQGAGRHGAPTSQYKGVSKVVSTHGDVSWRVIIKTTAKGVKPAHHIRINGFKTEIDAAKRYNEEVVKLRGEWAWVNPLPDDNHYSEVEVLKPHGDNRNEYIAKEKTDGN